MLFYVLVFLVISSFFIVAAIAFIVIIITVDGFLATVVVTRYRMVLFLWRSCMFDRLAVYKHLRLEAMVIIGGVFHCSHFAIRFQNAEKQKNKRNVIGPFRRSLSVTQ